MTQGKNTQKEKFHMYQRIESNSYRQQGKEEDRYTFLLKIFPLMIRLITRFIILPIAMHKTI